MYVRGILFEKNNDQRLKTTFIYRQVSSGRPQNGIQFTLKQIYKKNSQFGKTIMMGTTGKNNNRSAGFEWQNQIQFDLRKIEEKGTIQYVPTPNL